MFRLPNLRIMMFAIAITLVVGGLPLHGENILYLPTLQGANAAAVWAAEIRNDDAFANIDRSLPHFGAVALQYHVEE